MQNRPHRPRQLGFTLLEMMVTVTVVGILLAVGVPSFRYMANMNRVAAESNNLLGDIQFARSEAIKEGQSVVICASTDVNTVSGSTKPTCASAAATGATSWTTGWIVFSDANGNGQVDTNEPVFRGANQLSSTDTLSGPLPKMTFNREGFVAGLSGVQYFSLRTAITGTQWTRCVMISMVGTASVVKYDGTNCT